MHKMRIIVNLFIVLGWLATTAFQPLPPTQSIVPTAGDLNKVSPTNGSVDIATSSLVLQWSSSLSDVTYEYCVRPNKSGCPGSKWINVGLDTSVSQLNLTPGITYYWQV